jgi:hypothetical protein
MADGTEWPPRPPGSATADSTIRDDPSVPGLTGGRAAYGSVGLSAGGERCPVGG